MELRLKNAQWEMNRMDVYDYAVVNDDIEKASEELVKIVKSEIYGRDAGGDS